MQKMTNMLLTSPDTATAKGGDKEILSNSKTADGDDFSLALDKAGNPLARPDARTKQGPAPTTDEEQTQSDGVMQVLAQINFAADLQKEETLAANGDILPLQAAAHQTGQDDESEVDVEANTISELGTQVSPDILLALGQESPQELGSLSQAELEALISDAKILDDAGQLKSELENPASVSPLEGVASTDGAAQDAPLYGNPGSEGKDQANGELLNSELRVAGAASQQAGLIRESVLPVDREMPASVTRMDKTASEFSQVLGKQLGEEAGQPGATGKSSPDAVATQAASKQLEGAGLSVRLTPVAAGLEANLAGAGEEPPGQDLKSLTGIQSAPQQTPLPGMNRLDAPQFQLSLKQHADQANQMQEMIQRFSPVMKQQLITMVSQGVQQAEIRLDPPELGHMMVRIQVQGDNTQVQFQVSQHQTRDLVEQAMPRLRELLAEQGMQLTDGQVSQGGAGRDRGESGGSGAGRADGGGLDEIAADTTLEGLNNATSSASGIDYYA